MKITTVLFDLDGTLLPMDPNSFAKAYFGGLAAKAAVRGYEPASFVNTIWEGTEAMVKNPGEKSNETVFWDIYTAKYGRDAINDIPLFDEYYRTDFQHVKSACGFTPMTAKIVHALKQKGIRVILATNPLFPSIATETRIRWAGLEPEDFELYTTYENSCHCKPNIQYYLDILESLGLSPQECIMVGNDVDEDMIVTQLGMKVFLLTDCLLNKSRKDISHYPNGGFAELDDFLNRMI